MAHQLRRARFLTDLLRKSFALVLFFVSGACGLLYELVWIRTAGTIIGNTTYAVGTVVAVFMGGLALGARWGGRAADRRRGASLLGLYGVLEGGVAFTALLVPAAFGASEAVFRILWNTVGEIGPLYAALRVLLVAVLLIVPTTLMGATLPVLVRFLSNSASSSARDAGQAYAINTLGGVAGTLAAGFWMIPALGLRATLFVAGGLNLLIALGAILLARGKGGGALPTLPQERPPRRLALAVSAISGLTSLSYEVAWSRSLVLSMGSSVQAMTLILSAFILGLACGSAAAAPLANRRKDPIKALAILQGSVGVAALVLLPFLGDLPLQVARVVASPGRSYGSLLAAEFGLIALMIFIPATILGAVFPFACRLAAGSDEAVGRNVGAVYTWNTVGSILGTAAASFVLVPALGLSATIRLAATLNLILAAVLLYSSGTTRLAAIAPATALLVGWLLPAWNPSVLASGSYLYGRTYAAGARAANLSMGDYVEQHSPPVASYWDAYGLATVHQQGPVTALRVNGKVDASTGPLDSETQILVGHLPILHHPAPRRALVIGLGGGFTLGAVARHPLEHIDCVEISHAVVRASAHFVKATGDPLSDRRRVRLIEGDGRNLVQFSRESYDVIISEPSNLWVSGMANLFTLDFFQAVRRRLSRGGIFCQWLYASGLDVTDFRLVLRTFFTAFPFGSFWEVQPGGDYILLGCETDGPMVYPDFEARIMAPGVREQAVDPSVPGALGMAGHLLTDAAGARALAGAGPVVTDDRLTLEFTAPRSLLQETRVPILELLEPERLKPVEGSHFTGLSEEQLRRIARRREDRRLFAQSVLAYWRGDLDQALGLVEAAGADLGKDRQTLAWRDDVLAGLMVRAAETLADGRIEAALEMFLRVPRASAHWGAAQLEVGRVLLQCGRREAARQAYRGALTYPAAELDATVGLASMAEEEGRWGEAEAYWREAVRLRPDVAGLRLRLSSALLQEGRLADARQACLEALRIEPANPSGKLMLRAIDQR